MNIIESATSVLSKYITFKGRACRSEFWWWWLITTIIYIILSSGGQPGMGMSWISVIFWLATLLPTLAVTVRRHHDGNRSGWWILIGLIPILGGLFLLLGSAPGCVATIRVRPAVVVVDETPPEPRYEAAPTARCAHVGNGPRSPR